ncbi:hypothetical protein JW859_07950 [bacterium]|nr:hypothetical protein [bacterium]
MRQRRAVSSGTRLAGLAVLLLLAGCGGDKSPAAVDGLPQCSAVAAEVEAAPVPAGVDPALFAELQAELVRVLRATAAKAPATPPGGAYNAVDDLALAGGDATGWRLEWHYVNTGDYNLDGMVNVSDLTPVGQHFNAGSGDDDWPAARWADGNADGAVTVSDITPIGQNFLAFVAGYAISGAAAADGPWTPIATMDLPAPLDPAVPLSYALASRDYGYYRVEPRDGAAAVGTPSEPSRPQLGLPAVAIGTDTPWDDASIGADGGSLAGPDLGDGAVTVEIPAGAVAEITSFALAGNDGQVTRDGADLGGTLISLTADGYLEFATPALLSIPLAAGDDSFPSAFRVLRNGALVPLELRALDRDAGRATFALYLAFPAVDDHAVSQVPDAPEYTPMIWFIRQLLTTAVSETDYSFTTAFAPDFDGFSVNRTFVADDCNLPLELGMGPFAIWYFRDYKADYGPLVNYGSTVQRLIALRATTSVWLGTDLDNAAKFGALNQVDGFNAVKQALVASGGPVLALCAESLNPTAADYAVACGYEGDELLIYHPSLPMHLLRFNALAVNNRVALVATDRFPMYEPFGLILRDALDDPPFGGSDRATITIDSPVAGATVTSESVELTGHVVSGAVYVEELYVLSLERAGELPQYAAVPPGGDFTASVRLGPGTNHLLFITRGYFDEFIYRPDPYMLQVPNNLGWQAYSLVYQTDSQTGTLAGTIVDADYRNELSNIDVTVRRKDTGVEVRQLNADRSYSVDLAPGDYLVDFSNYAYQPLTREFLVQAGTTIDGAAALTPLSGPSLSGHVWEVTNATRDDPALWVPLGGVEVTWTHEYGITTEVPPLSYRVTTDGSGSYVLAPLTGLRIGNWRFLAEKAGYRTHYLDKCSLPAPDQEPLSWTKVEVLAGAGAELDLLLYPEL